MQPLHIFSIYKQNADKATANIVLKMTSRKKKF